MAIFGQAEIRKPKSRHPGAWNGPTRAAGDNFPAHGRIRIFNEAGTVDDRRCFGHGTEAE